MLQTSNCNATVLLSDGQTVLCCRQTASSARCAQSALLRTGASSLAGGLPPFGVPVDAAAAAAGAALAAGAFDAAAGEPAAAGVVDATGVAPAAPAAAAPEPPNALLTVLAGGAEDTTPPPKSAQPPLLAAPTAAGCCCCIGSVEDAAAGAALLTDCAAAGNAGASSNAAQSSAAAAAVVAAGGAACAGTGCCCCWDGPNPAACGTAAAGGVTGMACIAGVVPGWLGAAKGSNTAAADALQQKRIHTRVRLHHNTGHNKPYQSPASTYDKTISPPEWTEARVTYAHAGTHTTTTRALLDCKCS